MVKCPKCGGDLGYYIETMGSFVTPIKPNGELNLKEKKFYGHEYPSMVTCFNCFESFNFTEENNKITLKIFK